MKPGAEPGDRFNGCFRGGLPGMVTFPGSVGFSGSELAIGTIESSG